MKIGNDHIPVAIDLPAQFETPKQSGDSFASMLDAERLKAENQTARSEILADQKTRKDDPNKEDIEYIREHGMRAYAEEVHKQKMEELREKILEAMGLTEEALSEMPADQRLAVEKMISQEIQKRMAANSLMNDGPESKGQSSQQASTGGIEPGKITAAQVIAGDPGSLVGLTISEMEDSPKLYDNREADSGDR